MKRLWQNLTLSAVCVWLASCSTSSTPKSAVMTGAYSPYAALTAADDSLFNAVMSAHQELKLSPRKVSRQVVAGMNYRFECLDASRKKVEIVIYEPLPGNGKAHLVSINGKTVE